MLLGWGSAAEAQVPSRAEPAPVTSDSATHAGVDQSVTIDRDSKASHAVVGSTVRLRYTPSEAAGSIDRTSVVEGRLVAVDSDRFAIALDDHDTTFVRRRQAMSIMVREGRSKRGAYIGAAVFGMLMGAAIAPRNADPFYGERDPSPLPWIAGCAAAGALVVRLTTSSPWVATTFP